MQALVKTARDPGHLELREVPIPQIAPDEVLIRVRTCGICGSDLKIQDDQHPYTPPVVVGHEFAGEIAEVGSSVAGWAVGDRVVSEQHTHACGRCASALQEVLLRASLNARRVTLWMALSPSSSQCQPGCCTASQTI